MKRPAERWGVFVFLVVFFRTLCRIKLNDLGVIMIKKLVLVSLIGLAGCEDAGPVGVVYKAGSTGEQRRAAVTNCEVNALSKVPRAMATAATPSYRSPSNVRCYGSGNYVNCREYGGQTYGGNLYSYDANQDLRDSVTLQCLQSRGYQMVSLPVCNSEQAKRVVSSSGRPQPTADKIECVVEGGYAILQ